jgi:hypothetical protein
MQGEIFSRLDFQNSPKWGSFVICIMPACFLANTHSEATPAYTPDAAIHSVTSDTGRMLHCIVVEVLFELLFAQPCPRTFPHHSTTLLSFWLPDPTRPPTHANPHPHQQTPYQSARAHLRSHPAQQVSLHVPFSLAVSWSAAAAVCCWGLCCA